MVSLKFTIILGTPVAVKVLPLMLNLQKYEWRKQEADHYCVSSIVAFLLNNHSVRSIGSFGADEVSCVGESDKNLSKQLHIKMFMQNNILIKLYIQ